MAITHTALTSGSDATNQTSKATASISPAGNELIEVAFCVGFFSQVADPPPTPTVTGNGITYALVAKVGFWYTGADVYMGQYLFRGMAASPTTGAITIDFGSTTMDSIAWSVSSKAGVDTGGTNGSAAIVQAVTGYADGNTTKTLTLAAFGSANNATAGYFGAGGVGTDSKTWTPGTGFTEIHDTGTEYAYIGTQWRNDNDTSVDMTASATTNIGAIAVEIKAAAEVGGESGMTSNNSGAGTSPALPGRDLTGIAQRIMRGSSI